jgi:hypothetical protein
LKTITAPVVISRADLASLTVDAAQGNLDFAGRLSAQGKHLIETFGGNIELRFPEDFGATIDMESFNGKLHAGELPVTVRPRTGTEARDVNGQQYVINGGGGALISVSTLNGSVFLRKLAGTSRRR